MKLYKRKPIYDRILDYYRNYQQQWGVPPSIREVAGGTEASSTSVMKYRLDQLVAMGYLRRRDGHVARAYYLPVEVSVEPVVSRALFLAARAIRLGGDPQRVLNTHAVCALPSVHRTFLEILSHHTQPISLGRIRRQTGTSLLRARLILGDLLDMGLIAELPPDDTGMPLYAVVAPLPLSESDSREAHR